MTISSQVVLTFLLNACWQVPVIAALASLSSWLLRNCAARYRHLVWVTALVLSLGIPLTTSVNLSSESMPLTSTTGNDFVEQRNIESFVELERTSKPSVFANENTVSLNKPLAQVLIGIYLFVVLYSSWSLVRAWVATRRIRRTASAIIGDHRLSNIVDRCAPAVPKTAALVKLCASETVTSPITIGVFSPLIILPHDLLAECNDEVLTSAIGHEMVHIRRRDYALNLVYALLYLPLSFHPAAALIRRRIRQTRELSCDELVAERILNPEAYARSLVKLASSAPTLRLSVTTIVGIADADILEVRIMSLLKRPKPYTRRRRMMSIAASLLLLVPCLAVASFAMKFDLATSGLAQDPSQQEKSREKDKIEVRERITEDQMKERQLREELKALMVQDQTKQRQLREELKSLGDQDQTKALQLQEKLNAAIADDQVKQQQLREQLKVLMESTSQDQIKERQARELDQLKMKIESDPQFREEVRRKREMEVEMRGIKLAALVRLARINMDQAIQIATSQAPGKVLNCNLDADKWEEPGKLAQDGKAFYRVVIVAGDEPNAAITHVWVNAVDGSLIKTEKELPRKMRSADQQ